MFKFVGILPLFSPRVSPVPSTDREKECPGVVAAGDSSKPSCGCLGRDTIANAAARVGPAVVNLSVPQGLVWEFFQIICFGYFLECYCTQVFSATLAFL